MIWKNVAPSTPTTPSTLSYEWIKLDSLSPVPFHDLLTVSPILMEETVSVIGLYPEWIPVLTRLSFCLDSLPVQI